MRRNNHRKSVPMASVFRNCLFQVFLCLSVGAFWIGSLQAAVTVNQDDLDIERLSDQSLDAMRQLKILFGHQSIGANTILGLLDLGRGNDRYRLTIANVFSSSDFGSPKLGHFKISVNGNPMGKIYEFADAMKGYGDVVDVAFFKLCPFDIKPNTDIPGLFNVYKKTMASLKVSYPRVTFVHVTCPLVDSEDVSNAERNQFNRMLLNEYGGREYIFDIAAIESTHRNGARAQFNFEGQTYYKLCGEYRVEQDRVHLNEEGRRRAAEGMVYLLSTIASEKRPKQKISTY